MATGSLMASSRLAAQDKLEPTMQSIELHYNRLATLRLDFEQEMLYSGRRKIREVGSLALRRPQKMRWEYSEPEGKLLVGDGDRLKMYNPLTNQVRTVKVEDTGDLRAPLAFLLGRLRFTRQFRNLRFEQVEGRRVIVGEGRSGKEYYNRVEFGYEPADHSLTDLRVFGRDDSLNVFRFSNERINPTLAPALFVFEPPPGAEIIAESPLRRER